MKKLFIALNLAFLSIASFAQDHDHTHKTVVPSAAAVAPIQFTEVRYDFGKIKQGVPVTHDFAFKNVTKQPVVIESATASCGCTTPVKPEAPVAKGKSNKITAGFNAAAAGPFEKSITIKIKGYEAPIEIKIAGQVLSEEEYAKFEQEKNKKSRK
jgi:hypothetical protein